MELERRGKSATKDLLLRAGLLGGKLGFMVAGLYSVAITVLLTGLFTWAAVRDWLFPSASTVPIGVAGVLMLSFSVLLVASALGILPGTILGGITAILVATPLFLLRQRLTVRGVTMLGVGIALLIAAIVHLVVAPFLLNSMLGASLLSTYLTVLGLPSMLYIVTTGYGSRWLFKRDLESRQGAA